MPEDFYLPDPAEGGSFCGLLKTSKPSENIDDFRGELHFGTQVVDCSAKNIILSGSVITHPLNSKAYGVVFAIGRETKINIKQLGKIKRSFLERRINVATFFMLLLLAFFVIVGVSGKVINMTILDLTETFQVTISSISFFSMD